MNYAIVKVGNSHNGNLPPGLLILVPIEDFSKESTNASLGSSIFFMNPTCVSGWSPGKLIAFTTAEQDARIEN